MAVSITRRVLRTPRAAALAGIVFAVLLSLALVLIRGAVPADPRVPGQLLSDAGRRGAVLVGLQLVPFAGIAFLWFIGVVRDLLGEAEDRLFSSVFLGTGVLFVGLLFVAAGIAAALIASATSDAGRALEAAGAWDFGRRISAALVTTYAMRMAAVFTLSTSTILLRTHRAPRWIAIVGYLCALVLLVSAGQVPWVEMIFPSWVAFISITILVMTFRERRDMDAGHALGRNRAHASSSS